MRLILHIGTEKTGSTALQQHLHKHRGELATAGIATPEFLKSSNHRALASVFVRDDLDDDYLRAMNIVEPRARERHREQLLRRLQRDVKAKEKKTPTYLITSEHFHSRLLEPSEVQSFAHRVAPLFTEVRIICYLRRQDRMALSFYTQKLRGGFIPPTILPLANVQRLAPQLPPFFDFEALLGRWADAFGEAALEPAVYSPGELLEGDVVRDFYQRIDCPHPGGGKRASANESLSVAGQVALLAFNKAHGGDLAGRTRARPLRERFNSFLQQEARGPGILPSLAEARQFLDAFAESNQRVAQKWFARDTLFAPQEDDYPLEETAPDWAKASLLLARFLAEEGALAC